ncbi:MAG: hypothetical protein V6Z89_12860 [Desulfobacter sp.]
MENRYGTTADMVIQEVDLGGISRLIAIDNKGLYLTTPDRVDRMVADVNRYGVSRKEVNRQLEQQGLDPFELFNANKYRVRTGTDGVKGKALNPIKASKRRM